VARRPSKHTRGVRPLSPGLAAATETSVTGDSWVVRSVSGAAAQKIYRCPGCQQEIARGVPHLVVWPAEPGLITRSGVEERRHWHTACWRRR
jgi:hypothetical protein